VAAEKIKSRMTNQKSKFNTSFARENGKENSYFGFWRVILIFESYFLISGPLWRIYDQVHDRLWPGRMAGESEAGGG
jgi:hypothetical protein